jgi:3-oxoacyl-[acyl-carrier protein] reductase
MSSSTSTTEVKVSPAPAAITQVGKVAIVTGASRYIYMCVCVCVCVCVCYYLSVLCLYMYMCTSFTHLSCVYVNRGIGAGIALRLARDGAKVVVNYQKDKKAADAVVAAISSTGGSAVAVQADASSSTDVDRLFSEAKRIYGRVDIVVANAGIFLGSPIATQSNTEFDKLFDVNVKGVFYALRAAANHVEANGRIVVLGSILKSGTSQGYGAYSATKAAVEVLANTAAQELGAKGITVNTIHPGPTDTDMLAPSVANPGVRAYFEGITPFKRLGTVADIADSVALVTSESARWISGQNIVVAGAAK